MDQGSAVEITYPNLYKGLNLKPKDLIAYDSPIGEHQRKNGHSQRPDQITHID